MQITAIAAFAVVSTVRVYACYSHNKKLKDISKGFIMPTLLWFYLVAAPVIYPEVVAAIIMSFLGDMLLIKDSWLTAGGFAFFFAHISYILHYLRDIDFYKIPIYFFLLPALIYVGVAVTLALLVKGHVSKSHMAGASGYIIAVCVMSWFALMRLFCLGGVGGWLTFVGTLFFIASDYSLMLREFRKDIMKFKHKYALVMVTYIVAQFLIILGIVQTISA